MANRNDWSGRSDGTPFQIGLLTLILRYVDVRVIYGFMAVVVLFHIVFGNRLSRHIYRYFRTCHSMGRAKALRYTYRTYLQFGEAIMDRYAVYAGRRYHMVLDDNEAGDLIDNSDDGLIILASHIGNYEMAGYLLSGRGRRMNVLLYAGEKALITQNRIRHFSRNNINSIIVDDNMDHVFDVNRVLGDGEIVSLHADRMVNSQRSITVDFFARPARLPLGPFLLAASTGRPVVSMFVMKERWNTYRVISRQLTTKESSVRSMAADFARQYAAQMESIVHRYPTQWFQFYDFWKL